MKDRIAAAGNTLVPAVLTLESKGYRVWWSRDGKHGELWHAEGPLGLFLADDPVELLGLVAMRESRGENWQASDSQIDSFMSRYDTDQNEP